MRIVDRYLLIHFIKPLLFCICFFVTMFILVDSLNNLDDFLGNHTSARIIVLYYACMIPVILSYIMPSAVLIAAMQALSGMNRHNEIVALRANGLSSTHILFPLLFIALVISVLLFMMNDNITPQSAITSTAIRQGVIQKDSDNIEDRSIKNVAMLASNQQMLYARELILNTQSIFDVVYLEHRGDLSLKSKSMAVRGVYENGKWTLYDVVEYEVDRKGNTLGRPRQLKKKIIGISAPPREFLKQYTETQFMGYRQLKKYLDETQMIGFSSSNRLEVDLHSKIATPLMCFILLWVAAPMALKMRRGGAMLSMGMGLFVIVIYYSIAAFSTALGKGGAIPPFWAAWIPNGLFALAGLWLWRKSL